MDNIELNSHGVNKAIKATILSDERMKEIGFHKNFHEGTKFEKPSPYWFFRRAIEFPKEKEWKNIEIGFSVRIPKDGSDIEIDIIDEDFGQPYDYQYMLSKYPYHKCANIVKEQVEKWMKYLQDNGVLSGHVYGEYI